MTTIKLDKGTAYDTAIIRLSHWQQGDEIIDRPEGYSVWDYFGNNGEYKGADVDGIEPVFISQSVLELADVEHVVITHYYSRDGMFGSTDPDAENIDVDASFAAFEAQASKAILAYYPYATVNIIENDNAGSWRYTTRYEVDGERDDDEARTVEQIVTDVWEKFEWVVTRDLAE